MAAVAEQPRASRLRRALMLSAVMLGAAVYEINLTNVTVALPHMQGSFSATHDQVAWIVTAFVVGMTMGLTWAGWFSVRFGQKQFFMFSLIGYTVSSFLCGAASSLQEEVAWRFVQGAIGAPLMSVGLAMVLDAFPRHQHGTANTIFGIGIMFGPVAGPVIGGYIAEFYHWSWIFYFNLPFGLLAIIACWILLPKGSPDAGRTFDWLGFATLVTAVGVLQLILNRGERLDWFDSLEIVLEAAVFVLSIYLFVVHSLTARRPFIELAIFRDRNVVTGLFLVVVWAFLLHGTLVLLSLMMQELRGYPVIAVGYVLAPRGFGVVVGMFSANFLLRYFDPRYVMAFGGACLAISAWAMTEWTAEVGAWAVIWTGALSGFSSGCTFVPLSVKTFSTIERRYRAEGLTLFMLLLMMGIGAGIAVAVNVLTRSTTVLRATMAEHVTDYNEVLRHSFIPETWDTGSMAGLAAIEVEIMRQAAMIGYLNYFYLVAVMAIGAIPLIFIFSKGRLTAQTLEHHD